MLIDIGIAGSNSVIVSNNKARNTLLTGWPATKPSLASISMYVCDTRVGLQATSTQLTLLPSTLLAAIDSLEQCYWRTRSTTHCHQSEVQQYHYEYQPWSMHQGKAFVDKSNTLAVVQRGLSVLRDTDGAN
jgi:hypothetical protein